MTDISSALKRSRAPLFILAICLALPLSLSSQTRKRVSKRPVPVVILDSTRKQDGLLGPVQRVRSEIVRPPGKRRTLIEYTVYDSTGKRIENVTYPLTGSTAGEEIYEYDSRGQLVATIVKDKDGAVLSETFYAYDFDASGNWIKMTSLLVVGPPRQEKIVEGDVTYRTITYFPDPGVENSPPIQSTVATTELSDASAASETPAGERTANPHEATAKATAVPELEFATLNDKALSLPQPSYLVDSPVQKEPLFVNVKVIVDETGRVVSAEASDGPPRLREAAEDAARKAVFLPFRVDGKLVRASGQLTYRFKFTPR